MPSLPKLWNCKIRKARICPSTETITFGEAVKAEKSSDMSARGAPDIERQIVRFDVLSFMENITSYACGRKEP